MKGYRFKKIKKIRYSRHIAKSSFTLGVLVFLRMLKYGIKLWRQSDELDKLFTCCARGEWKKMRSEAVEP